MGVKDRDWYQLRDSGSRRVKAAVYLPKAFRRGAVSGSGSGWFDWLNGWVWGFLSGCAVAGFSYKFWIGWLHWLQ